LETGDQGRALQRFHRIEQQLPGLLDELEKAKPHDPKKRPELQGVAGVYLLTEEGVHRYVGRTRNAWRRLGQHFWKSSGHNSAPLAFNIAKAKVNETGLDFAGTREELAAHPAFVPFFEEAKQRVAQMEFRIVELTDPVLSTIFEVYVSLALQTEGGVQPLRDALGLFAGGRG
jgi:hypothetical protein